LSNFQFSFNCHRPDSAFDLASAPCLPATSAGPPPTISKPPSNVWQPTCLSAEALAKVEGGSDIPVLSSIQTNGRPFPLSPRERAGVRGNLPNPLITYLRCQIHGVSLHSAFFIRPRPRPNGPPSLSPGHRPGYTVPIVSAPQRGAILAHLMPMASVVISLADGPPESSGRLPSPLGWAEGLARRWRSGAPASAIGWITGWPTATIRNLATFPALAILPPREASWSAAVLRRFCCQPTGHCDHPLAVSRRRIRSHPDHAPQ